MKTIRRVTDFPKGRPHHIHGAGRGGVIVRAALITAGREAPLAFVDRERTGTQDGTPIIALNEFLATGDRNGSVIIASQHWAEIADTLRTQGFVDLYDAYPLIQRHLAAERPSGTGMSPRERTRMIVIWGGIGILALSALLIASLLPA